MTLTRETIEKLEELVRSADGKLVEAGGHEFSTQNLFTLPHPTVPEPKTLGVSSLQAVVDYLEDDLDELRAVEIAVHIESPTDVCVVSALTGPSRQRFAYLHAGCDALVGDRPPARFQLNTYAPLLDTKIALLHLFRETPERARLVYLLSRVRTDDTVELNDNGASQEVSVRGGVHLQERATVENPFHLAPFRSFPDIEAPESPFLLRADKARDGVAVGLFEADGGMWRVETVKRIRAWLSDRLPDFQIIG